MTHDLYLLTAVIVALTMLTLVVGYARVLVSAKRAAFHIAASTCLVFFAFAAVLDNDFHGFLSCRADCRPGLRGNVF